MGESCTDMLSLSGSLAWRCCKGPLGFSSAAYGFADRSCWLQPFTALAGCTVFTAQL